MIRVQRHPRLVRPDAFLVHRCPNAPAAKRLVLGHVSVQFQLVPLEDGYIHRGSKPWYIEHFSEWHVRRIEPHMARFEGKKNWHAAGEEGKIKEISLSFAG